MQRLVLERERVDELLGALSGRGYRVIGPSRIGDVLRYDEVVSADELPSGWRDEQAPGRYRLTERADAALFGFASGPQSPKQYLHPPKVTMWTGTKDDHGFRTAVPEQNGAPYAFFGVKPCDLAAIAIQDRVLGEGTFADRTYRAGRTGTFVVAVNCTEPAGTCFCVSMGTGPEATSGFDLALTEVITDASHQFLVETGSAAGGEVAAELGLEPASDALIESAQRLLGDARERMGRELETEGLQELVARNARHPLWEEVARRCLACGNCTMVCPTCFCTTVDDIAGLDGASASRVRRWDSCFTGDFSYIHGGSLRASTSSRYRQWLTHKVSSWVDQFGTSGCVGCGRCITWCPVGIDITAELAALRTTEEDAYVRARVIP